jgi:N-methylhydantoinase B
MYRGGLGQRISFKSLSPEPLTFMIRHERVKHPPRGFLGGLDGATGLDLLDGVKIPAKSVISMKEGQIVTFETPGGGGMSPAHMRERSAVERDLIDGVVSAESAQRDYGLPASEIQQILNAKKADLHDQ